MPDAILKQGSEAAPALPGSARAASLAPAPALLGPEWKAKRKQQRSRVKGKQPRQKEGGLVFSEKSEPEMSESVWGLWD